MVARRPLVRVHGRRRRGAGPPRPTAAARDQLTYTLVTSNGPPRARPGRPTAPRSRSRRRRSLRHRPLGRRPPRHAQPADRRHRPRVAPRLAARDERRRARSSPHRPGRTTRSAATGIPAYASSSSTRTSRRASSPSPRRRRSSSSTTSRGRHRHDDAAQRARDDRTGPLLRLRTHPGRVRLHGHRVPRRRPAPRLVRRDVCRARRRRRRTRRSATARRRSSGAPPARRAEPSRSRRAPSVPRTLSTIATRQAVRRPLAAHRRPEDHDDLRGRLRRRDSRAAPPGDAEPAGEPEGRPRRGLPEARSRPRPQLVYLFRLRAAGWDQFRSARVGRAAPRFRNVPSGRYYVAYAGGDAYWSTATEPFSVRR